MKLFVIHLILHADLLFQMLLLCLWKGPHTVGIFEECVRWHALVLGLQRLGTSLRQVQLCRTLLWQAELGDLQLTSNTGDAVIVLLLTVIILQFDFEVVIHLVLRVTLAFIMVDVA